MSQIAFKYFTINTTATAQPLVGTWLTASFAAPITQDQIINVAVNDSSMFKAGSRATFQTTTGTNQETAFVTAVPDSTHINIKGLSLAHTGGIFGTGEFVSLNVNINSIYVQAVDGNTGNLFIGVAPNFSSTTGVNMIAKLVKVAATVQPIDFSSTRTGATNADNLAQLFIIGTNPDTYLPSYGIV